MTQIIELQPVSGGKFSAPVMSDSNQVVLFKDNIKIVFSKKPECFGKHFDWQTLDLSGLYFGESAGKKNEYFVNIQPGSWLSRKLNNEKCAIELQVYQGHKIAVQSHVITNEAGEIKKDLPQCCQGFVNKTWQEQGWLCFLLRRACVLTIEK